MRTIFLAGCALGAAVPSHAGVVTFADRTAFDFAAGPITVERFDHCARVTTAFTGPLGAADANAACGAGAIAPGLVLAEDSSPGERALYLAAPHYTGNRAYAVGENGSAADALGLEFTPGTRAAGFDIFQNFGGGAQLGHAAAFGVWVYAGQALLGRYTVNVPSGRGAFFGVVADGAAITRIAVNNALAYDTVGTIAFAAPLPRFARFAALQPIASTPEPAAIVLLGLGTALLVRLRSR